MASLDGYILGIDVGTTSTKGTVLDSNLNIVAGARSAHQVDYPRPGFAEQHPELWWHDIKSIVRQLSSKIPLDFICAVGISSMCPTVVPVSKTGEPLRPAILYGIDSRASKEVAALNETLADTLPCCLYTNYTSQSILPKMAWVKQNEPEIYEKTRWFLTTSGYVVYRLTGQTTVDYFTASAGNLVDLEESEWYQPGFEVSGVSEDKLPELKWSGEIAGTITKKAASETGLPENIPVSVGTCDAAADAIVCGCVNPGDAAVSLGGTTICVACNDSPLAAPNLFVNTHAFPGRYTIGGATSSGGLLLEWFARSMLQMEPKAMFKHFEGIDYQPSDLVVLPFLNGARTPFNNTSASALFAGMTMKTNAQMLYTAVLEAVAFDLSMIVEEIEKSSLSIQNIRISGGGVRNKLLLTIIAEVLNREMVAVPPEYDAAAGSAILAYQSTKGMENISDLCNAIPNNQIVSPTGRYHQTLTAKKSQFLAAYEANCPVFDLLSQ